MRNHITLILIVISIFCSAQTDKKAEMKSVNGIIIYSFIQDSKFHDYYCSLKTKIVLDSSAFDFIPQNDFNHKIIRKNREFEDSVGAADSFLTGNIETNFCVFNPNNEKLKDFNCDSVINVYRLNNIYDSSLYRLDMEEHMTLRINSDAVYSKSNSDTIYIAFQFYGSVIQYDNIIYGAQTDYRMLTLNDGTEEFDDSHSLCPFEKYDSTIIVLNKVSHLRKIDNETQNQLGFIKSKLTELKIFLYE